jgi:hypothetical protein
LFTTLADFLDKKRGEEHDIFSWVKDGIFFPLFLSEEPGTGPDLITI